MTTFIIFSTIFLTSYATCLRQFINFKRIVSYIQLTFVLKVDSFMRFPMGWIWSSLPKRLLSVLENAFGGIKLDSLIVSFPAVALLKFAEGVNLILWKKPFRSTFNPTIITENQFQMVWNTLIDFIMRYVNI